MQIPVGTELLQVEGKVSREFESDCSVGNLDRLRLLQQRMLRGPRQFPDAGPGQLVAVRDSTKALHRTGKLFDLAGESIADVITDL